MKTIMRFIMVGATILAVASPAVAGQGRLIGVGMRRHVEHSEFEERPFGEDDISYTAAYEYREGGMACQVALDYTPDPEGAGVDFVATPQLNVFVGEKMLRAGVGVLDSYVSGDDDDDWSDLYWQLMVGLNIPLSRSAGITVMSYYPFEQWDDLGEFGFGDVEFGGVLFFSF